jgi:hypothetical protein
MADAPDGGRLGLNGLARDVLCLLGQPHPFVLEAKEVGRLGLGAP